MDGQVAGAGESPELGSDGWEVLFSPARPAVPRRVGLAAAADASLERFARPVALLAGR